MAKGVVAYDYTFPVVGGELVASPLKGAHIRQIFGTAANVGDGWFVTNEHVIRAASAHSFWGIAFLSDGQWKTVEARRFEYLPGIDIGLIEADIQGAKCLQWVADEQPMLTDVQAIGYPYALDVPDLTLTVRAFRGTIVGARTWRDLASCPQVYELSFACPRGLSGASLWRARSRAHVVGVVFGNSVTDMIVRRDVERDVQAGETTIYERVESLRLGMALQCQAILPVQSTLLGITIGDFLQRKGLLVKE